MITDIIYSIGGYIKFSYDFVMYELFRTDKSIKEYNKEKYVLTYRLNDREYNILIDKKLSKPLIIMNILDYEGRDRTEEIEKLLGPCNDFHGIEYKLKDFDTESLTIHYFDGSYKIFDKQDQVIKV